MDLYSVFNYPFIQTGFTQSIEVNYKSEHYRFKTTEIDAETNKEELYVIFTYIIYIYIYIYVYIIYT